MKIVIKNVSELADAMSHLLEIHPAGSARNRHEVLIKKYAHAVPSHMPLTATACLKKDFDAIGKDLSEAYTKVSTDLLIHATKGAAYQSR